MPHQKKYKSYNYLNIIKAMLTTITLEIDDSNVERLNELIEDCNLQSPTALELHMTITLSVMRLMLKGLLMPL